MDTASRVAATTHTLRYGSAALFRAAAAPRRVLAVRRRNLAPCRASAEAEQLLVRGRSKYDAGDRMEALRLWEQALQQNPTQQQRNVALYNAAAVHAYFGDLELAQIPLKEAIFNGLDFQAALAEAEGSGQFVKIKASTQVLKSLKKFNEQVLKAKAGSSAPPPPSFASSRASGSSSSGSRASGKGVLGKDMSDVLSTDAEGIDASIGGIIKRVIVLLLALSILGTALFYLGLKYMFPESMF